MSNGHKHNNLWWGPPKNFAERKHERKIGWLELFYDLVYVAAISQITHHLSEYSSWSEAGYSFLLFALVFWSWVNGSQYYDLHGNDGIRTRLLTFWQMLAVAAVAVTMQDAFMGNHRNFAIAFAVVQLIITYLWWSVGLYDPSHRIFNKFYTFNYLLSLSLFLISLFTGPSTATVLWIVALVLNLTPPLIGARTIVREMKRRGQVFTASAAIVERFGLLTIIILTETILGTVTGITEIHERRAETWIGLLLTLLIAFLLWSLYFDMMGEQETKTGYSYLQWLIFLHFPLLASLCFVGAGTKVLIAQLQTGLTFYIPELFCLALSTILFCIVGLTRIMKEDEEDRVYIRPVSRLLIFMGLILLALPALGNSLSALAFMSIITSLLFIPVFVGIRSWVRYKFFNRT